MNIYQQGLPGGKEFSRALAILLILLGDLTVVAVGYLCAFFVRFESVTFIAYFPVTKGYPLITDYFHAAPVILLMWALAHTWNGMYHRVKLPALDEVIRVFRGTLIGTLLAMSAMFLYREGSFSRIVFIMGGGFAGLFVYAFREAYKIVHISWVRRTRQPKRVLVIGKGYLSLSIKKILDRQRDSAVLRLEKTTLSSIQKTMKRSRVDEVLVADANYSHNDTIKLATYCEAQNIPFRLLPDILEMRMGEVLIDESLGIPTFKLKPVSLHGISFLTKRVMDVAFASLVLGIIFIPLVCVALFIKLSSPGAIFYQHKRMGYRGKEFDFLKFRTMVSNADDLLENLKGKSDRRGHVFKMKNDPRVIPIGQFLRRYSIDELPQLLNVLLGEMSIVGPRPQVLWETKVYDDWARKRLNVLPGITGLWQVSGRAELTFEEMIELDIFYIEHWSPGLDIKIILKTLPAILFGKGAY